MSDMSEIIKASLEGIGCFSDMRNVIGDAINTPSGVTVIPVSKITVGFAGGGVDFGHKKLTQSQSFGTGSGTGLSVTPLAFLTIGRDAEIKLISVDDATNNMDHLLNVIERSPEIISRIKNGLS